MSSVITLQRVLPEFYEYGMGTLIWRVLYIYVWWRPLRANIVRTQLQSEKSKYKPVIAHAQYCYRDHKRKFQERRSRMDSTRGLLNEVCLHS